MVFRPIIDSCSFSCHCLHSTLQEAWEHATSMIPKCYWGARCLPRWALSESRTENLGCGRRKATGTKRPLAGKRAREFERRLQLVWSKPDQPKQHRTRKAFTWPSCRRSPLHVVNSISSCPSLTSASSIAHGRLLSGLAADARPYTL